MTTKAKVIATTIDCDDPRALAAFYAEVLGMPVQVAEDEYAAVGDGTWNLYFARLPERKPVAWPSDDKQFHIDLRVPDVEQAVQDYLALGATKPEFQPGVTDGNVGWIVMQDPAGHVFCVCPEQSGS
ncbi:VOC family protein [Nonomuraea sp. NBC_01738]|uniref:VOC family protein n=1 Tax=Nonomuraea sp. NBC_01738 TaxID=2976003 RepID=UPI002E14CA0E|nr:VOC family protein [Nonomuraea sp. NBC_01738]